MSIRLQINQLLKNTLERELCLAEDKDINIPQITADVIKAIQPNLVSILTPLVQNEVARELTTAEPLIIAKAVSQAVTEALAGAPNAVLTILGSYRLLNMVQDLRKNNLDYADNGPFVISWYATSDNDPDISSNGLKQKGVQLFEFAQPSYNINNPNHLALTPRVDKFSIKNLSLSDPNSFTHRFIANPLTPANKLCLYLVVHQISSSGTIAESAPLLLSDVGAYSNQYLYVSEDDTISSAIGTLEFRVFTKNIQSQAIDLVGTITHLLCNASQGKINNRLTYAVGEIAFEPAYANIGFEQQRNYMFELNYTTSTEQDLCRNVFNFISTIAAPDYTP